MKRWIKWTAGSALLLGVIVVATAASGLYLAEQKRNRYIDIKPRPVAYTTDAQTIERGRYLYASRGCTDCHGAQGTGREFVNDGKGTRIVGPNITPAGVVARYQPEDWNSVIRHGVKPNGRPVLVMPSEDYNRFTDQDLAALAAYVQQLPAVDGEPGIVRLPVLVKLLYAAGVVKDAYEKIDHTLPVQTPVAEGVNVAHGAYVANMCMGCHGEKLAGGKIPGAPPDWPAASNLTSAPEGAMHRYLNAQQFRQMLTTGTRPDGSAVSTVMPFGSLKSMSQTDADALYLYLKALPPVPTGSKR